MEFIIGILVGGLLYYVFCERKRPSGTFVIDLSDPVKDVCKLELDENLDSIYSKKHIVLNVKTYAEQSPK